MTKRTRGAHKSWLLNLGSIDTPENPDATWLTVSELQTKSEKRNWIHGPELDGFVVMSQLNFRAFAFKHGISPPLSTKMSVVQEIPKILSLF